VSTGGCESAAKTASTRLGREDRECVDLGHGRVRADVAADKLKAVAEFGLLGTRRSVVEPPRSVQPVTACGFDRGSSRGSGSAKLEPCPCLLLLTQSSSSKPSWTAGTRLDVSPVSAMAVSDRLD